MSELDRFPPRPMSEDERKLGMIARVIEPVASAIRDTEMHKADRDAEVEKQEIEERGKSQKQHHDRAIEKQRSDSAFRLAEFKHQAAKSWAVGGMLFAALLAAVLFAAYDKVLIATHLVTLVAGGLGGWGAAKAAAKPKENAP